MQLLKDGSLLTVLSMHLVHACTVCSVNFYSFHNKATINQQVEIKYSVILNCTLNFVVWIKIAQATSCFSNCKLFTDRSTMHMGLCTTVHIASQ